MTAINFGTDLKGQVALVTGASAGLGVRFAKVLAQCGAKVAITARRMEKLEALAKEIRVEGGEVLPLQLDVTQAGQLLDVVGKAEAALDDFHAERKKPRSAWWLWLIVVVGVLVLWRILA